MAAKKYLDRKNGREKPAGSYRAAPGYSPWSPDDDEEQFCCTIVRTPSWNYPNSLLTHCKSAEHVATVCGVDRKDLLKTAKIVDEKLEIILTDLVKPAKQGLAG